MSSFLALLIPGGLIELLHPPPPPPRPLPLVPSPSSHPPRPPSPSPDKRLPPVGITNLTFLTVYFECSVSFSFMES